MNRRTRWLAALLVLLPAVGARSSEPAPAEDPAALSARFEEAFAAGDYAKALALAETRNAIVEEPHVDALYDIARPHAMLGRGDEAYAALKRAADAGFWNVSRIRKDPAFRALLEEERYRSLARGIWARSYLGMLERPERAEFQKPDQVMRTLEIRPGERVADVGAGSGYFTIPVAKAVGPEGVVWAIDIAQEMLDHIAKRLEKEGLTNVRLVKVAKDDPELPPRGVDTILMVDTIHYVKDRAEYAKKLREGLAPGGRLVVIDYVPKPFEERPWGPLPEQQVSRETLDAEMAAAGFAVLRSHDFLTEQYFVEYRAAGGGEEKGIRDPAKP